MFGCKAGQVFQVAAAVAVTTVRIAAVAAAIAATNQHRAQVREEREAAETTIGPPRAEGTVVVVDEAQTPNHCTELRVETAPPAAPGSPPPPRAFACGANVIIQDEEGRWRRYDEARDAAPAAP
jgi:hypothetical protein